jgi:phosphotransferase system enzyme I (PtsI)
MLKGIAASSGIGIGTVRRIEEQDLYFEPRIVRDIDAEKGRFERAKEEFLAHTEHLAEQVKERIGEQESVILLGQLAIASDPELLNWIESRLKVGVCAESAVTEACDHYAGILADSADEVMSQRAADVKDVKTGLLKALLGKEDVDIAGLPRGTVLVARELTPSMTSRIVKENIAGIVTETGGKTSHVAIMARAMEIPAVLSVPWILGEVRTGETLIVDGIDGEVVANPSEADLAYYRERREKLKQSARAIEGFRGSKTETKDGKRLSLLCNIGSPEDAEKALNSDGEGVGLFRTEFLFLESRHLPTEEEHVEAYSKAIEVMGHRELIIRLLDIGGDKSVPCLDQKEEENPFLGCRAVRFGLKFPDIYRTQIRAILRAGLHGDVKIMVPMVSCIEELRSVRDMIIECSKELQAEGIPAAKRLPLGVMMETASAAVTADLFAREADFFSIGTNDLVQYLMSADRGNPDVADLNSVYQPSSLRSIRNIIRAALDVGIEVGMCGEAAAEPMMIPLLISFGLTEFSVNPAAVLRTRAAIASWSREEADRVTEEVMNMATEGEIVRYLERETASTRY